MPEAPKLATEAAPSSRSDRFTLWLAGGALLVLAVFVAAFALAYSRQEPPPDLADNGPGNPNSVYRAEQPVEIWHATRWYPGRIHAVGSGRYFITYDGFSISWNEWVTARRLRPRAASRE